eukprot:TRINITY_DN3151_c0_g1_i1.p1 TRINITY_DN3151_c0_g1~~TRINITY_DN3151_c0_g1_i1.p1  ORF type:complete len:824 (-),score=169.85 TRINITY_DN3151_c0_g1_i1:258-2705(-)
MSHNIGLLDSTTDTSASQMGRVNESLDPLTEKILKHEDVVDTLQELRRLAKGNDLAKGYIGERCSQTLVQFVKNEEQDLEERVEGAKLLRSITVYRKNKTLGNECASIIHVLHTTTTRALKLALTATLWNLSALAENRGIIVAEHGLEVLSDLLKSGDLGLQREAAGAIRNITLDEKCRESFTEPGTLDALISLLGKTDDMQLLICMSGALRNLSISDVNRVQMQTEAGIAALCDVVRSDNSKLQNLTLATLINLSQDADVSVQQLLASHFTKNVYGPLLNSKVPNVHENTVTLLKNLKEHLPDGQASPIQDALRNNVLFEDSKLEVELLKKLNLDGTIHQKDIILIKKIGEGQYGDVWASKYHGYPVACKVLKRQLTPKDAEKALEELRLMTRLKHPNCVLLMGACLNEKRQIMIVTEYATRGDLRQVAPHVTSLSKRLRMGLDMASGLAWLHAHNIVHRDLKLPNLLVFSDWTVKVGDFGLSLQLEEGVEISRFGGNVKYSAPEILKARYDDTIMSYPYCEETDVYSFGLMLWELITLKPLFVRPKEYKGKKGLAKYVLEGHRPALEKHWPESLQKLLSDCWHEVQSMRPKFRDIIGQWDTISTDMLCPDHWGRQVARRLWPDPSSTVTFMEFQKAFADVCMPNSGVLAKQKLYLKLLNALLCDAFDDAVTKQRWCNVVGWFAPIDQKTNCRDFFHRIQDLFTQTYFHGFLSEQKAEHRLKQLWESTSNKQSYYVVRFSESDVGGFILTFIDYIGHVQHEKITNRGGMWYVEGICEEFDSWKKVKNAFKQVWNIGVHLPKGPYDGLFKKKRFL